ncbi:hypothetical protein Tco_0396860 [Tanacetum coccineum]
MAMGGQDQDVAYDSIKAVYYGAHSAFQVVKSTIWERLFWINVQFHMDLCPCKARYAPISFKYLYASDFLMYIESGRTNDDRKRMAEQPPNAKMVVEDIKIELWVETCDGSVKGFVKSKGLNKMFKVLMEAENGKKVRKKLKEVGAAAKKALAEDGSS